MSRVANAPITLPTGVEVKMVGAVIQVSGKLGELSFCVPQSVGITIENSQIAITWNDSIKNAKAFAGTTRASVANMVKGVSEGFVKKMQLVGVGYRAQISGQKLTLSLGYSNPVEYIVPEGIVVEAPSQTELLVKGSNRQQVGQVASEIRAFRPPEPYKGKGVKLADEFIARKEAKKK
ncbi:MULTISPECIES: 50S ribosomal protein L6 [Methylomonas]|uniref:50S ribosomal protein L6 n=1 Tax=Methylomonas TaxID=416 RepID=UPI0012324D9D|nr:50S ribosomal protein L6 [Methylomonas rhizoryzae]